MSTVTLENPANLIKRFEELEKNVDKLKNQHAVKLAERNLKKDTVKQKKEELEGLGYSYSNMAELEEIEKTLSTNLSTALSALENKIAEIKANNSNL